MKAMEINSFKKLVKLSNNSIEITQLDVDMSYLKSGFLKFDFSLLTNVKELKVHGEDNYDTPLPDSLFEMVSLRKLEIIGFNLGNLTTLVSNLKNLEWLSFECSKIHSLPLSIDKLKKLEYLGLNDVNELQSIPETIGFLNSLQEMKITCSDNCASIEIPNSFGDLKNLQTLWLDNLRLRKLPLNIYKLKSLKCLTMTHNDFEFLPEGMHLLNNLHYLDLSFNKFKEYPESLCYLPQLKSIKLGGNEINYIPECLSYMSELEYLDLCNNNIDEIPDFLFEMKGLKLSIDKKTKERLPAATIKRISKNINRGGVGNNAYTISF